jgi:ketosteroid isomerase-like protein
VPLIAQTIWSEVQGSRAIQEGVGQTMSDTAYEFEGIQSAFLNFIEAFRDLDWQRFCECFAEDATVFHPDNPETERLERIEGLEAVKHSFKPVFEEAQRHANSPPYLHLEPKNIHVQLLWQAAVVSFEFDRAEGSFGRRTLVLQKSGDAWKIVHLHASNFSQRL